MCQRPQNLIKLLNRYQLLLLLSICILFQILQQYLNQPRLKRYRKLLLLRQKRTIFNLFKTSPNLLLISNMSLNFVFKKLQILRVMLILIIKHILDQAVLMQDLHLLSEKVEQEKPHSRNNRFKNVSIRYFFYCFSLGGVAQECSNCVAELFNYEHFVNFEVELIIAKF